MVGVGLNQFRPQAKRYVREPGVLTSVELIVERPQTPHSLYLQVLAEMGLVGLALLLLAAAACVRAAWQAARRFDSLAMPELAVLSRAVLVAILGALAASAFITSGPEKRFWAILALGPAVLALSYVKGPPGDAANPAPS